MTSNVELRFIISIVENPTDMITVDLNSFPEFDVWVKKYLKYEKITKEKGKTTTL